MKTYEGLIELIYDGVTNDAAWADALELVAETVGAAGAGLGVQDMETHAFWAVAQSGVDVALHETYQRLAPENHIWRAIGRAGRPMADQMVMPKTAFARTALHAEWFVPQGFHSVMAAPVMANGSHCGVVVAFGGRARGDFEALDLDQLGRLGRHLSQALSLRLDRMRLADALQARNHVLDELADGVLLLDKDCRVRHANLAGQVALDRRDGFVLRDNRLVCRDVRANEELQRALMVAAAAGVAPADGWVVVPRDDRRALLVQVTTCRGAELRSLIPGAVLMVRVKDPDGQRVPTPALLRELLGLTLGEAKAILAVARMESQDQAAESLGVAKTTLRTHLHHAYQKLGIHNRAELMRVFAAYNFRDAGEAVGEG